MKEEVLEIGAKNEVVTTALNLGQYMDADFKGIFQSRFMIITPLAE